MHPGNSPSFYLGLCFAWMVGHVQVVVGDLAAMVCNLPDAEVSKGTSSDTEGQL